LAPSLFSNTPYPNVSLSRLSTNVQNDKWMLLLFLWGKRRWSSLLVSSAIWMDNESPWLCSIWRPRLGGSASHHCIWSISYGNLLVICSMDKRVVEIYTVLLTWVGEFYFVYYSRTRLYFFRRFIYLSLQKWSMRGGW